MRKTVAGVVATLALVTSAGSALAVPVLPDGAKRSESPHHRARGAVVRVLDFNIHHGANTEDVLDLERIAQVIRTSGAEVVGLQEVDNHWGMRSGFVDQAAWLAKRTGMNYCYSANLDLDPAKGQARRQQYGTAILSTYKLKNCTNTPLPNHPGGEQRGLAQADIKVRGVDVRVFNTHLTHNSDPGRLTQARVVDSIVNASDRPVILTGDMNATPESAPYSVLSSRLTDGWKAAGKGPGYTSPLVPAPKNRIDYVFTSDDITPVGAEVVDTDASDHYPVLASMRLPHPGKRH